MLSSSLLSLVVVLFKLQFSLTLVLLVNATRGNVEEVVAEDEEAEVDEEDGCSCWAAAAAAFIRRRL